MGWKPLWPDTVKKGSAYFMYHNYSFKVIYTSLMKNISPLQRRVRRSNFFFLASPWGSLVWSLVWSLVCSLMRSLTYPFLVQQTLSPGRNNSLFLSSLQAKSEHSKIFRWLTNVYYDDILTKAWFKTTEFGTSCHYGLLEIHIVFRIRASSEMTN